MEENVEWLKSTGYIQSHLNGSYCFEYRKDSYMAYYTFSLNDVINAPLEYIKKTHKRFLKKAENKEIF